LKNENNFKIYFMTHWQKMMRKLTSAGALAFVVLFFLGIFVVSPLFLLIGLDLLEFNVDYSLKNFLGAILIIIVMRVPTQKSNGK